MAKQQTTAATTAQQQYHVYIISHKYQQRSIYIYITMYQMELFFARRHFYTTPLQPAREATTTITTSKRVSHVLLLLLSPKL